MKNITKAIAVYLLIGIVAAVFISLFALLQIGSCKESVPTMKNGVLDAEQWCLSGNGLLSLNGEWQVYWNQLLTPEDITFPGDVITVPGEMKPPVTTPFAGYATLRTTVKLKNLKPDSLYGISTQYLASSSRVWINGREIASTGRVAKQEADYIPEYQPVEAFFRAQGQELDIVIQVANFHHRRVKLGMVYIGTADSIKQHTHINLIKDSIVIGCLLVIALYNAILYLLCRRDRAALWLSFIASSVALRGSVVSERILLRLVPELPAEWMMKLGYLPTFLLLPLFLLYLWDLFSAPRFRRIARVSAIAISAYTLMVVFTDIKVYDIVFEYTQLLIIGAGIYVIYVLLANRLVTKTRGSINVLIGGCIVLLAAVNDTLRELNIINTPEMLTMAMVMFIILQAIFLGWRLNDAYFATEQMARENEAMLQKIQNMNTELESMVHSRTMELELANTILKRLSLIDPLTQIANRRWFSERVEAEWSRSMHNNTPITLLMIDIDFFKLYNDTYGHLAGDECLRAIAGVLKLCVRDEGDIFARYGGEEFVMLLPSADINDGIRVGEKMLKAVSDLCIQNTGSAVCRYVTVSVGICSVTASDATSVDELIENADQALYRAKENGRNRMENC